MNLQLLNEANVILNKCGGREIIEGGSVITLERKILFPLVCPYNSTQQFTKQILGDSPFELRAISSSVTAQITGIRLQVRLPSGRFLLGGNGQDIGQFGWVGSWRYPVDPPEQCDPGSNLEVTLTDYASMGPFPVNLLFEGVDKYFLKGGKTWTPPISARAIPKYQGILNENILAPAYVAGVWPKPPVGSIDSQFTYSSFSDTNTTFPALPNALSLPVAGPNSATLNIPIDAGIDFVCRRILADVNRDAGVTAGEFLVRIRTSGGYAFTDGFVDIAQYFSGSELAHDWVIPGGDQVNIDVVLADGAGAGNIYLQIHLEGSKRRQA